MGIFFHQFFVLTPHHTTSLSPHSVQLFKVGAAGLIFVVRMYNDNKDFIHSFIHFTKIDANSARCNICQKVIAAKASNTTNLMNYLTVHKINLRAESCSVFDCKKGGPQPSSSQHSSQPVDAIEPELLHHHQNLHHWTRLHLRVPRTTQ